MAIFGGSTKTKRAVADPGTDDTLPSPGSLSWGGITTASAIAGTTGADSKLVFGDRWQQINGSQTEFISGNFITNIMQNQTLTVSGNRNKLIAGNLIENIVGTLLHTVIGAVNALYVSPKNDVHASPHNRVNASPENQQEPTSKIHILGVEFEHKQSETTITDTSMGINGLVNEYNGWKNEVTFLNAEMKVFDLAAVLGISAEPKVCEVELKPLKVIGEGGEAKLAAGVAAVAPSVNAVPHIPTVGGT